MRAVLLTAVLILAVPMMALAAGGHDMLSCTGCHSIHDAKAEIAFGVEPNTKSINPSTDKPFDGVTALCLGCHENTGGMGILPIVGAKSHPYGVTPDPKVAGVPAELLRDGKLECVGCHDPHPSNPNYRYLRVPTDNGASMQNFCSLCHSSKSGRKVTLTNVFTSMDEATGAGPRTMEGPDMNMMPAK